MLPKQIIQDGRIYDINESYVKNKLLEVRRQLINGEIPYDFNRSFGSIKTNLLGENRYDIIKSLLFDGQFVLTKDKKNVCYLISDGENYYPIVDTNGQRLKFDLIED